MLELPRIWLGSSSDFLFPQRSPPVEQHQWQQPHPLHTGKYTTHICRCSLEQHHRLSLSVTSSDHHRCRLRRNIGREDLWRQESPWETREAGYKPRRNTSPLVTLSLSLKDIQEHPSFRPELQLWDPLAQSLKATPPCSLSLRTAAT